ncbi:hypothetical protein ACFL3D_00945 [Candidatus Omnitrophota bacterium]
MNYWKKILSLIVMLTFFCSSIGHAQLLPSSTIATKIKKDAMEPSVQIAIQQSSQKQESLRLYEKSRSNMNIPIRIGEDISEVGDMWAIEIIKALQFWQNRLPPNEDIIVNFCTGDTPWIGYKKLADWITLWREAALSEETKVLFQENGIALNLLPDMKRVQAFPLDAIFPQKRDAYFSFHHILSDLFNQLGIPTTKQHFFYGDVAYAPESPHQFKQMNDTEFALLMQDVDVYGLRIDEFEAFLDERVDRSREEMLDQIHSDVQFRFLYGMKLQAEYMRTTLMSKGGPHIFLSGVGPSYEGKGHIGFLEEGSLFSRPTFIERAGFFINAGHAKENGGIAHAYAENGQSKYGAISFGFDELLHNVANDEWVIAIATNNDKARSIQVGIEGEMSIEYPITGLQYAQRGALILDYGAAYKTHYREHPWDYEVIPKYLWTKSFLRKFFMQLSIDTGKPLFQLTLKDFLNSESKGSEETVQKIHKNRRENMKYLLEQGTWEMFRDEVSHSTYNQILPQQKISEYIGIPEEQDKVMLINPHYDDAYLAVKNIIDQFHKEGKHIVAYVLTKGFTAVHDEYTFSLLQGIQELVGDEKVEEYLVSTETEVLDVFGQIDRIVVTELAEVCTERESPHISPKDFNPWNNMEHDEKKLRAQSLLLYLIKSLRKNGIRLDKPEDVYRYINFIMSMTQNKPLWGAQDVAIMQSIKTFIRITEEKAALMSLGLEYYAIHAPVSVQWYTGEGRGTTADENDIDELVRLIKLEQPSIIISNGEGFPDFGAHATTEVSIYAALLKLQNRFEMTEGEQGIEIGNITYIQYAGVWERFQTSTAQLSLLLTHKDTDNFSRLFRNFYPSQAPAACPDAGIGKEVFFSDQVIDNARRTLEEIATLLVGDSVFMTPLIGQNIAGILNYTIVDLQDPLVLQTLENKIRQIKRVRIAKENARSSKMHGTMPLPEIPLELAKHIDKLKKAGSTFTKREDVERLFNIGEKRQEKEAQQKSNRELLPLFAA